MCVFVRQAKSGTKNNFSRPTSWESANRLKKKSLPREPFMTVPDPSLPIGINLTNDLCSFQTLCIFVF